MRLVAHWAEPDLPGPLRGTRPTYVGAYRAGTAEGGPANRAKPGLKRILDAELQNARTASLGQNLPEVGGIEIDDRVTPVEMVDQIERL